MAPSAQLGTSELTAETLSAADGREEEDSEVNVDIFFRCALLPVPYQRW